MQYKHPLHYKLNLTRCYLSNHLLYTAIFLVCNIFSSCNNGDQKSINEPKSNEQKTNNCSVVLTKLDSSRLLFNTFYNGMKKELFYCAIDSLLKKGVLDTNTNVMPYTVTYYEMKINENIIPLIVRPVFNKDTLQELQLEYMYYTGYGTSLGNGKKRVYERDKYDHKKDDCYGYPVSYSPIPKWDLLLIVNLYKEKYGKPIFSRLQENANGLDDSQLFKGPLYTIRWGVNNKVIEISYSINIIRCGKLSGKIGLPEFDEINKLPIKDTAYSDFNILYTSKYNYESIRNNQKQEIEKSKKETLKSTQTTKKDI